MALAAGGSRGDEGGDVLGEEDDITKGRGGR